MVARASVVGALLLAAFAAPSQTFRVRYSQEAFAGPFSGSVVVYLSKGAEEPRLGPSWTSPEPVLVARFRDVGPGRWMLLDGSTVVGGRKRLEAIEPGEYLVQAVVDRNLGGRAVGTSPGNLASRAIRVRVDSRARIDLTCDTVLPEPRFEETGRVKLVRLRSQLLSAFHRRPVFLLAAVGLPEGWSAAREWPVVYEVPGFGGSVWLYSGLGFLPETDRAGEPFVHVVLDPECPTGHSVFADSANNGPYGRALVEELIPEIERRFRCGGRPEARFVTGHSSGGWASLWLQIQHPDVFGGCWSTAPDYVDFRSFCNTDIYRPGANLYAQGGRETPLIRGGGRVLATVREFCLREYGLRGEQMGSFVAVFSPRGRDGQPAPLWDWETGAVDPKVAEAWRAYDIGHVLRTRWAELGPKLRGKLFVACGEEDTFYLERPLRLLARDLETLDAGATVLFVPGDHSTMMTPELRRRIDREIAERYRRFRESKASTAQNDGPAAASSTWILTLKALTAGTTIGSPSPPTPRPVARRTHLWPFQASAR
ncbi:MAG: alpha/beta hydrolase-fold protein [Fimbriimonadales bacterium]|nr:alpha/beta hydrolase-fold protein [Fimbriimonadales bacterium]